jgi:LacI family transcriptional regulator
VTVVRAPRHLPTITDVAARAGVSTATVSKVINARSGVAAPTAQRVLSAIEAMGYEPSLAASRLRGGTARVVGVLFSDLGQWAGEVLEGVSTADAGSGYGLLEFSGGGAATAGAWERRALIRLGGTLIDGAILIAPSPDVILVDLPVVVVTAQGTASGLDVVGCDGVPRCPGRAAAGAVPRELGSAALTMLLSLIGSGSDGPGARKAPPLQWQWHCGPV